MADQTIIDKYLREFYEVQKLTVPIELHPYLHRMIDEAVSDMPLQRNMVQKLLVVDDYLDGLQLKEDGPIRHRLVSVISELRKTLQQLEERTPLLPIPDWIIKYSQSGHQSSAAKAIGILLQRCKDLERIYDQLVESDSNGKCWFNNYQDIDQFLISELDKVGKEFPIRSHVKPVVNTIEAINLLIDGRSNKS